MALKSTIRKATISLSDMDRDYYDTLHLTLAQHPSETEQRLIVRLLAFILNAHEDLQFGKGVSDEDEAAIWQKNYADEIELWIELGKPDEKRIKKACNQAQKVMLYCYGTSVDIWWQQNQSKMSQFEKLTVQQFPHKIIVKLSSMVSKSMDFQCSIQDGQMWLTTGEETHLIELVKLQ